MQYTNDMIQAAKSGAGALTLAYIEELEKRLQGINATLNTFLVTFGHEPLHDDPHDAVLNQQDPPTRGMTSAKSPAGGLLRLCEEPSGTHAVEWNFFWGGDNILFYTQTPEEARVLFLALQTVVRVVYVDTEEEED